MERLNTIISYDDDVIFLDFKNNSYDKAFFREILHRTDDLLVKKSEPQLFLADFTGIGYTHKYCEMTKQFISKNSTKIKAAALTGIHLEQEIDPHSIKDATLNHIRFFDDINKAREWLSKN